MVPDDLVHGAAKGFTGREDFVAHTQIDDQALKFHFVLNISRVSRGIKRFHAHDGVTCAQQADVAFAGCVENHILLLDAVANDFKSGFYKVSPRHLAG